MNRGTTNAGLFCKRRLVTRVLPLALWWLGVAAFAPVALAQEDLISVASPDGQIEFRLFSIQPPSDNSLLPYLAYQVDYKGARLIDTSFIGFEIYSQVPLGGKLGLTNSTRSTVDETYTMPVGKTRVARNHYNSLVAEYLQNGSQGRLLNIEVRAFDDGVAFRYVIPESLLLADMQIEAEYTQFHFAKDGETYPLILESYQTNYEDQFRQVTLSAIHPDEIVGLPFLAEQPGVGWVAITEANLDGYPGMYLWRQEDRTMAASLSPALDGSGLVARVATPFTTPWRVLMIGDTPAELIESNIVTSLNPPSAIADTSWIRAGKTFWNGWNGTQADGVDFEPGMNTATMEHYIDFASEAGLEYMLIDAGWSREGATGTQDLLTTIPGIDLPRILEHAASRQVGVWLWADWNAIDSQMDEAFPLFERLGVKGVKIDNMNRDDQWMTGFYRRVAEKAAEHHLMVNFHGAYKPDGLRRTYPNVITREGVLGLEYSKWSARATPEHNVMLAFTRMLAGPMDYTPGGFNNVTPAEFVARDRRPMVLGTRAHQLALYVVFESPTMMVSDYPEAYADEPAFQFIRDVPATWDETRAVNGEVGEFVTIARRSGEEWYVGAITDGSAREVALPLDFLAAGEASAASQGWVAEVYADAADADDNPKNTTISEQRVSSLDTLTLRLAPGGGAAIRFRPAQ